MPRRRALLVSLGVAAAAGCVGSGEKTPTDVTEQPSTDTPTETDEPTDQPSPDPKPPDTIDADWPLPGHDSGNSNRVEAAGPTRDIAELWSVGTDSRLSQPVLADGTLYVGSRAGDLLALDARTGQERWRQSVGDVALTPRVVAGLVCVPTAGAIVALDPSDGAELWRVETPNRADAFTRKGTVGRATLLAASHGLYWVSGEGDGNEENPTLVSIAPEDGSERWRTDIGDPWSRRLFAGEGSVFVSTNHNAPVPWRLDADSGEVLERPSGSGADFEDEWFCRDGTLYSAGPLFGPVEATPVGDGGSDWSTDLFGGDLSGGADAVYGVLSDGGERELHSLAADDGSQRWAATVSDVVARPVVADECVLVRTEDALRCFDPADGTERWSHPGDTIGGRVVVADDLLFTTRDGTVRAYRGSAEN